MNTTLGQELVEGRTDSLGFILSDVLVQPWLFE